MKFDPSAQGVGCDRVKFMQFEESLGTKICRAYFIGAPVYLVSPGRSALWRCSCDLTQRDLAVIYRYSATHEIALGRTYLVNMHDDRGGVAFTCWPPGDPIPHIAAFLSGNLMIGSAGREAFDIMRKRKDLVTVRPTVSISKPLSRKAINDLWGRFLLDTFCWSGETYAEAIEDGLFRYGLEKIGGAFA